MNERSHFMEKEQRVFMVSDLHLDEDLMFETLGYDKKYANTAQRTNAIIADWNEKITPSDIVYILGDFYSFAGKQMFDAINRCQYLIHKLNGLKNIVLGNHDTEFASKNKWNDYFFNVYNLPVVYDGFYILSHEPVYISPAYAYVNIFGHIHDNENYAVASSCGHYVGYDRVGIMNFEDIKKDILFNRLNNESPAARSQSVKSWKKQYESELKKQLRKMNINEISEFLKEDEHEQ